jgi:hypothetical protein
MKKFLLALVFVLGLISCDNNDNPNTNNSSVAEVTATLTLPSGLRINQFIEDGVDKTNFFSSYVFEFNSNGAVTATNSNGVVNGTYLVFRDDNRTELRMTFPNTGEFFELTDDWYFDFQNDTLIRFEDSGDSIQFEKL